MKTLKGEISTRKADFQIQVQSKLNARITHIRLDDILKFVKKKTLWLKKTIFVIGVCREATA